MSEKVTYEVADRVATVTIRRPEVRNAMDRDVFDGLRAAGERAGSDPAVRTVVVTGEGQAFSSGIDVTIFGEQTGEIGPAGIDIDRLQRAFSIYEDIAKPTIAAVHGYVFGGGIQLAIACDLRVAAEDVSMSVMETRWGIIPDLGAIHRLPRIVGVARAKDLMLTGRRMEADEALAWGLVNRVVPPGEDVKAALAWARELAAGPPMALARIKRLTNAAFDVPVPDGLRREAAAQRPILAGRDFGEAVAARFEKRDPEYEGR